MNNFPASKFLVLLALACFLLASFSVTLPVVALVPLGLTFLAGSMLC